MATQVRECGHDAMAFGEPGDCELCDVDWLLVKGEGDEAENLANRTAIVAGLPSKVRSEGYAQVCGDTSPSPWGPAERLVVARHDGEPMGWREVWEVFAGRFPGRWAFQWFPPADCLVDEANKYHLWVLPEGVEPSATRLQTTVTHPPVWG